MKHISNTLQHELLKPAADYRKSIFLTVSFFCNNKNVISTKYSRKAHSHTHTHTHTDPQLSPLSSPPSTTIPSFLPQEVEREREREREREKEKRGRGREKEGEVEIERESTL